VLVPRPRSGAGVAAAYRRTFGRAVSRDGLLGFDAMQTVLAAVRQAGRHGNDRAAVARALQRASPLPWTTARPAGGRIVPASAHAPTFEP
jgi:ABC-type branched-subunit amino acid transport system substrate-binding protein